jgi:hypothetical protein
MISSWEILIPPESALHLQLVVMGKHLLDNELAAQILMPPESALPLLLVAMDKHLLDDELAAQLMMLQALDHPQCPRNRQPSDNHTSEVFVRFEIEAPDNLAAIERELSTIRDRRAQFLSHSGRFDRRLSRNSFSLPFWELFDLVVRKLCPPSLCCPTTAPRNMVPEV